MKLIEEVKGADRQAMPNARVWLDPPIGEAMVFAKTENLWSDIRSEFHGRFKEMVYGDTMPGDDEVLASIRAIKDALLNDPKAGATN